MEKHTVLHVIEHEVRANSRTHALKKSESFVRPLIDKDAANDRVNWRRILEEDELLV